jgi:CheY-like chemotaxis protein
MRLLVVDDHEDTRELMGAILEAAGAQVTLADSAAVAMSALGAAKFAVLISDIGMPIADGYDLIREVRKAGDLFPSAGIPAVAVTAFGAPEDRRRALAAGFQEHLPKPVNVASLLQAVARLGGKVPV